MQPNWEITIKLLSADHQERKSTTVNGPKVMGEFFDSLKKLLPNENAVDAILAHENSALMWSWVDEFRTKILRVLVQIVEVEPNTFTFANFAGDCIGDSPVQEIDAEHLSDVEPVVASLANDTTLVTNNQFFATNCSGYQPLVSGLMAYLVTENKLAVLRTFLEREERSDRDFEVAPFRLACKMDSEEIVAMFMYYNVPPDLTTFHENGNTYYRHPVIYSAPNEYIAEMLFDYTFDERSDLDVDYLFKLMLAGSDNLKKATLELCRNVRIDRLCIAKLSIFSDIWPRMFTLSNCFLKRALAFLRPYTNGYDLLLDGFIQAHWTWYWRGADIRNEDTRDVFIANLFSLGGTVCEHSDDEPKPTILQRMLDKLEEPLRVVTGTCLTSGMSASDAEAVVLLLLANNAPMDESSFDNILKFCMVRRNLGLWNACRHMEVISSSPRPVCFFSKFIGHLASSYYHHFRSGRTIMDVLRHPEYVHEADMAFYVKMSSHPAVKERAANMANATEILEGFPEFPTLLEFARDAARNYLIDKYNIKTGMQLHLAVSKLEMSDYQKKIIEYDLRAPLYNI